MSAKGALKTREEHKKIKSSERKGKKTRTKPVKESYKVRLIPIPVRVLLVLLGMAAAIVLGAIIGYGILGEGEPLDVFKRSTWQHIIDLVVRNQ
ncbi:DNA-directed RNA polymerase subunit beta [Bacillus lacus]|uniref:DNA-directed RNA polymerase subunit beta n=1 Tax=Metabacillus lacus TaxID=1983721 RepID=A0A7X2J0D1_9BACI|nr:DNA-directed RNA polymerase subunit beta [Metabacillus lacus]MRX73016.1 DNA-directed RNA polymerase subunit beta [Metabacillus lacus]